MAGVRKKPRRERTGDMRPPSRARNQPREPRRRKTRAGGRGRARRFRAQKGSGGGADGMERNGTRRRERYAGTEPQSFGGGMGNMTKHDTLQGVFHEPPRRACARARSVPVATGPNARLQVSPRTERSGDPGSGQSKSLPGCSGVTGPRIGGRGDNFGLGPKYGPIGTDSVLNAHNSVRPVSGSPDSPVARRDGAKPGGHRHGFQSTAAGTCPCTGIVTRLSANMCYSAEERLSA